jgi:hypothetical protein
MLVCPDVGVSASVMTGRSKIKAALAMVITEVETFLLITPAIME